MSLELVDINGVLSYQALPLQSALAQQIGAQRPKHATNTRRGDHPLLDDANYALPSRSTAIIWHIAWGWRVHMQVSP